MALNHGAACAGGSPAGKDFRQDRPQCTVSLLQWHHVQECHARPGNSGDGQAGPTPVPSS